MIANLIKSLLISLILVITVVLFSIEINANEMEVPQDELAQESVLPIFDNTVAIKNRNVRDAQTLDLGFFAGMSITEPIASTTKYGLSFNYHLNTTHAIGFLLSMNSTGLSKDAEGLKNDFGLDFSRAPYPQYALLGDYNYKLYYGKLSVTKKGVINTSIYTSGAAGLIKYIHKSYPTIAVGVGERFYFTDNFAFKVDLRLFVNSAPIPFKTNALKITDPVPAYDSFADRMTFTTSLEFGLNYLF